MPLRLNADRFSFCGTKIMLLRNLEIKWAE
jgi:hypothetical protein